MHSYHTSRTSRRRKSFASKGRVLLRSAAGSCARTCWSVWPAAQVSSPVLSGGGKWNSLFGCGRVVSCRSSPTFVVILPSLYSSISSPELRVNSAVGDSPSAVGHHVTTADDLPREQRQSRRVEFSDKRPAELIAGFFFQA